MIIEVNNKEVEIKKEENKLAFAKVICWALSTKQAEIIVK
jgi:hypothetical protein